MDTLLLKEEEIFPADDILQEALGKLYSTYKVLMTQIIGDSFGLTPEWHYYQDGKAWLCKIVFKKKTVFWLSIWKTCFKVSFYFTEKTIPGIRELAIDESIKESVKKSDEIGKLIPLTIEVNQSQQIADVLEIIKYKKG
jgi:hypothetical protein